MHSETSPQPVSMSATDRDRLRSLSAPVSLASSSRHWCLTSSCRRHRFLARTVLSAISGSRRCGGHNCYSSTDAWADRRERENIKLGRISCIIRHAHALARAISVLRACTRWAGAEGITEVALSTKRRFSSKFPVLLHFCVSLHIDD